MSQQKWSKCLSESKNDRNVSAKKNRGHTILRERIWFVFAYYRRDGRVFQQLLLFCSTLTLEKACLYPMTSPSKKKCQGYGGDSWLPAERLALCQERVPLRLIDWKFYCRQVVSLLPCTIVKSVMCIPVWCTRQVHAHVSVLFYFFLYAASKLKTSVPWTLRKRFCMKFSDIACAFLCCKIRDSSVSDNMIAFWLILYVLQVPQCQIEACVMKMCLLSLVLPKWNKLPERRFYRFTLYWSHKRRQFRLALLNH